MHINKIHITNFKGINDYEIEFKGNFNLIIGNNGTGKTSILEAISVGLGAFLAGVDDIKSVHFTTDEIRRETKLLGDGSTDLDYKTPVRVDCNITLNKHNYDFTRQKKSLKSSRSTIEPRDICKEATALLKDDNSILPVISYQSFSRIANQRRDTWANSDSKPFSRSSAYIDCLGEASNTKMITKWFKRMEQISWQTHKRIKEYEIVKSSVSKFMNSMLDTKNARIYYDARTDELMYSCENESLPIRFLSSGFRTLIGMVLDIAYRMAILNPNLLNKVTKKTPGIVLIDEIDMHLHPKWQWTVVSALKETFPAIQFIATTHSPLIIASCKNEHLISLNSLNAKPVYAKTTKGWQIDDVLNSIMNTSNRDPDTIEKLNEISRLAKLKLQNTISNQELERYHELINQVKILLPENDIGLEEAAFLSINDLLGG